MDNKKYIKYKKYKKKYIEYKKILSQYGGDSLVRIKKTDLEFTEISFKSGGGYLYKVNYKGNIYMYKQLVNYESGHDDRYSDYEYESESESELSRYSEYEYNDRESLYDNSNKETAIKNIVDNEEKFNEMLKYPNLIAPKYLVIDTNYSIDGYLMEYLENYERLEYFPNILCFYKILLSICYEFLNIIACKFKPCTEHSANVMILYNNTKTDILRVVLIDLDDIQKCSDHNDKDTIDQLNTIMLLNLSYSIAYQAQDIIDIDGSNYKIKNEFDTIYKLIDAINRIIPNLQ
jgi:hypothetical protein